MLGFLEDHNPGPQVSTRSLADSRGRTLGVIPDQGPKVTYGYSELDQLTQAVYGSATTTISYDLGGRKISMTDADMGTWTYGYDSLGKLTGQTDARACTTTLTYDGLNRLTGKSYSGCPSTPGVTFTYDQGTGQLGYRTGMAMSDGSVSVTWSYDARGRLVDESKAINGMGTYHSQWTYNSADLPSTMTYPADNANNLGETVTYTYLPQMALDSLVGQSTYQQSATYDAAGRMITQVLGSNVIQVGRSYYPWKTSYGNGNSEGRLATLTATGSGTLQNLAYQYDSNGNIGSILNNRDNPVETQSFSYDRISRLLSASANGSNGPYSESYTYDANTGNLASKGGVSYTYSAQHPHAVQSLSNGNSYAYDNNGNMTTRTVGGVAYSLAYDAENHLVSVSGGGMSAAFVYDGDGRRVKSTISGVTVAFVGSYYEYQGTTTRKYYYAGGQRVAVRENSVLYYLLRDHLGSTSITTTAGGSQAGEMRYKAFGEVRYSSGGTPTKYTFTGQYSDSYINLLWSGSRWYDPTLGRWLQPDSIVPDKGNPQGLDRYTFVANNPVKYVDPGGHCWGVASGLRGVPTYDTTCQNLDMALSIVQHPEASAAQRAEAGAYIAAEGLAHGALATGVVLLGCAVIGPTCTKVVEGALGIGTAASADGDPTNEALAAAKTAESVMDKLSRYLLNPDHPRGSTMAAWYEKALGFTQKNMGDLAKQIVFDPKTAYVTEVTRFGTKYNQIISVTGANGKVVDVVVAWIELADGTIKLVTTVPAK